MDIGASKKNIISSLYILLKNVTPKNYNETLPDQNAIHRKSAKEQLLIKKRPRWKKIKRPNAKKKTLRSKSVGLKI